jgi:hypothetical protein
MTVTIIPNLCQECHQHHHGTVVKSCRFCSDLQFPEQILCDLVRNEHRGEATFECDAFRPKLLVVKDDHTKAAQTKDLIETIREPSQKEKWFKAYAVQQLKMNPDQIYTK